MIGVHNKAFTELDGVINSLVTKQENQLSVSTSKEPNSPSGVDYHYQEQTKLEIEHLGRELRAVKASMKRELPAIDEQPTEES